MAKIETLLSKENRNPPFLEGIKRGAFDIATKYGRDVEEVLESIYNDLQAQVPEDNELSVVDDVAKGATGNLSTMTDTMNFGQAVINAYNLQ